ncbi:MAG: hypothetical protein KME13_19320 [Myxacorys californica WJT36-NPBG1]|nr:hypothetical protein [Myxacorys californica WJT36-NPBG1]
MHLFYLQASRLACAYNPDKRHNLASVGHAVLTDFGWQEVSLEQPAFERRDGDYWDNLSIWTGSIIEYESLYYLFYTARRREDAWITTPYERRRPQQIGAAVSDDLTTWRRTPTSLEKPTIPNPGVDSKFDGINWHDPYVIQDEIDGKFYAFICAHQHDSASDANGAIAYATSTDLEHWQEESYKILYTSSQFLLTEVPQVFWRKTNDQSAWRLYLIFCPRWSSLFNQSIPLGMTYYVRSQPIRDRAQVSYDAIPWESEPANVLAVNCHAGKLIRPESVTNPVFFGFQFSDEGGHFVGGVSDPDWATFADDGTISLSKPQIVPDSIDSAI